jgi:hypothetical protein
VGIVPKAGSSKKLNDTLDNDIVDLERYSRTLLLQLRDIVSDMLDRNYISIGRHSSLEDKLEDLRDVQNKLKVKKMMREQING